MEKLKNIFRNGELNEYTIVKTPLELINKLLAMGAISPTHDYIKNGYFEKGEKRPEYQLNKEETLYVATKYSDETRAKLIMRWKQLEVENMELKSKLNSKTYTIPEDYTEALLRIVDHVRTEKELTSKIKEDAPKVEYYTKVMASTDTVTATTIAKDYGMTVNALLHNLGVQFKQDGQVGSLS